MADLGCCELWGEGGGGAVPEHRRSKFGLCIMSSTLPTCKRRVHTNSK